MKAPASFAVHHRMGAAVFIVLRRSITMVPAEENAVGVDRHLWDPDACTAR